MELPLIKNIKDKSGMTIMELIIAMLVSGLLLGYGVIKYLDFNKSQTVKNVGLNVKSELRRIQGKALAGVKPPECGSSRLDGYTVDFLNSDAAYCPDGSCLVSQAVCSGTPLGDISIYLLTPNFAFDPPLPGTLTLYTLAGGTDDYGRLTIRGYTNPNDYYYQICITQGGDIKDCGFQKETPGSWADCGGCP